MNSINSPTKGSAPSSRNAYIILSHASVSNENLKDSEYNKNYLTARPQINSNLNLSASAPNLNKCVEQNVSLNQSLFRSKEKTSENFSLSRSPLSSKINVTKNTKSVTSSESSAKVLTGMDRYITITKRKSSPRASTLEPNSKQSKTSSTNQNRFAILANQEPENAGTPVKTYKPPPLYLREATSNALVNKLTQLVESIPSRIEIEINGNANITCHMNPLKFGDNVNSSSLYFEQEDTEYIVAKNNIHILNETTIVFMLRNATQQDRNYFCKLGAKGIGVTHVSVGTAPLEVTDFKCWGYDYTYMVCNFTRPHNVILTQYNLSYTAQSPNYIQICHLEFQQNQGICNLTMDKNNYRPNYEFFNFTLRGLNDVGTKVQNFWINHYESVIPSRPEYTFEKITSNTVTIKWKNPKYSFYVAKGLEYEIWLRPKGLDWIYLSNYEIRNDRSECKLLVRNLPYAYFWYELSVRLRVKKSVRNVDSYWSEPYIQKFQTPACPPDTAPLTDVGSFYIDSSESKVRIYWRQLPYYKENGPNFNYVIKEVTRNGFEVALKPLHIDRTSAIFAWHKHHNYTFTIVSQNEKGESPNNSSIFVPAWSQNNERLFSPKWIRNVYHATNRTSTLSWSPPYDQKNLIDYTVFWCQSRQAIATECEDSIYFYHVGINSTMFNTLPQKQERGLNLAVSANYKDFNTGMHWTMCSADVTSELIKLEPEIIDVKSRSITIQWSTDRVCSSLIEGYSLFYCRTKHALDIKTDGIESSELRCTEESFTINIPNTAKKFTIKNLTPYSPYKIQINMFSKLSQGNLSDPLIVITKEDAPSKPHNLRALNVTSNSVILTWLQPEHYNGFLRKYRIAYNNEHRTINCAGNEGNCKSQQIEYKLENLSSYTTYKIYIIAYTNAPSDHSNDITIKTLVGIPSSPRNVRTKENVQNILQWSIPEVPSGRVEFYEVAITLWYKDQLHRRHISGVINSNECEFHLPVCINADYRFTKEVRAVNLVRRDSEVDHYIFAMKNISNDDNDYYIKNNDLRCVGSTLRAEEQDKTMRRYQDTQKYVLYESEWEKGPITNCSDSKLSRITMLALIIVVSSLGVMVAFYVARNKYQKMANISCALPPGLEAMAYPIKDNNEDIDDFRQCKDPFFRNESRRLLSSISHDSGYDCRNVNNENGRLSNIAHCSLGENSGCIGSDQSTEYCTQETLVVADTASNDSCITDRAPVIDDTYMAMKLLKPGYNKLSSKKTFDNIECCNGYVQPNISSLISAQNMASQMSISTSPINNGYIKQLPPLVQTQMIEWSKKSLPLERELAVISNAAPAQQVTTTYDALPISSSGYVAPQLFQKALIPLSNNGYASLEALSKTIKQSQLAKLPDGVGGESIHSDSMPPISGYVTQKELSSFGQQQNLN